MTYFIRQRYRLSIRLSAHVAVMELYILRFADLNFSNTVQWTLMRKRQVLERNSPAVLTIRNPCCPGPPLITTMSIQDLNYRLLPLFEAHKQTLQLISRLAKLPAQPGSSASIAGFSDARVELGAEIRQSLKEQEDTFELLRQEVEDQTTNVNWASSRRRNSEVERDRTDLATQVTRLGEDLKTYGSTLEAYVTLQLTSITIAHVISSEKRSFKPNATLRLLKEKREKFCSQASRKATAAQAVFDEKDKKICHKTRYCSMLQAT